MVAAARRSAALIYSTVPSTVFTSGRGKDCPLSVSPEIRSLLGIENITVVDGVRKLTYISPSSETQTFPPVLYKGHNTQKPQGLFLSTEMFKACVHRYFSQFFC